MQRSVAATSVSVPVVPAGRRAPAVAAVEETLLLLWGVLLTFAGLDQLQQSHRITLSLQRQMEKSVTLPVEPQSRCIQSNPSNQDTLK